MTSAVAVVAGARLTAATTPFSYWVGDGAPLVSVASWNASGSLYPWSINPTGNIVYLDDNNIHYVNSFGQKPTTLSSVQTLDANFTVAEVEFDSSQLYVVSGSSCGTSSHTLTLNANGVSVVLSLGLGSTDSTTLSSVASNSTFSGHVLYLGYNRVSPSLPIGGAANVVLSYTGLEYVTINQSASFNNFLDITSSVSGTGGIEKNGSGGLILEAPTSTLGQPTIGNTFTGDFKLDAGTVLVGQDTDLFNSNPSLQHGALGHGNVTISGGMIGSADGSNHTIQNNMTISGDFSTGSPAGGGLILTGNIDLGSATRTITVLKPMTISGNITSSGGGLGKSGTGTLVLSGTNTYTDGTVINAGTLRVGSSSAIPSLSAVTLATGATLDLQGFNTTIGSLAGTGGAITLGSGNLSVGGNGSSTTFSGAITGTGGLTKVGAGSLTLGGTDTYSGGTTLAAGVLAFSSLANLGSGSIHFNGGALQFASGNTADISSVAVYFDGNGTIDTNGNNVTLASAIGHSGSGGLTKAGSGTLTFNAAETYTGDTTVNAGELDLGASGTLASGNVTVGSSGALRISSSTLSSAISSATLTANGNVIFNNAAATVAGLSGSGNVTLNSTTLTVSGGGTFSGAVADGASPGSLSHTSGTLILNGTNTYSGNTAVTGGELDIGSSGAIGGADISVGSTARLASAGTLSNSGNLTSNGTVTISGGNVTTSGTGTIQSAGIFNESGGNVGIQFIDNYGNMTISGGFLSDGLATGGTTIESTGTLNFTGGGAQLILDIYGTVNATSGGFDDDYLGTTVESAGSLYVNGGGATWYFCTDHGAIELASGSVDDDGNLGATVIASGGSYLQTGGTARLDFDDYGSVTINGGTITGTIYVEPGGSYTMNGGDNSLEVLSSLDGARAMESSGSTRKLISFTKFRTSSTVLDVVGTFNLNGGNLTVVDSGSTVAIERAGQFKQTAGAFHSYNTVNDGNMNLTGGNASLGNLTGAGSTMVGKGGSVTVSAMSVSGNLFIEGALTANATSATRGTPGVALVVGNLTIGQAGLFDLKNHDLIIRDGETLAQVDALIGAAYDNGAWDGSSGITSSSLASGEALGYATAGELGMSTFDGVSVNPTDILVKYTYIGDANLDGQITAADAVADSTAMDWAHGNFHYSGAGSVVASGAGTASPSFAFIAPSSPAPEPGVLAVLGVGMGLVVCRRRRTL